MCVKYLKMLCFSYANLFIDYSTEANIVLISAIKSSFFVLTAFTKAFFNKDLPGCLQYKFLLLY